MAGPRNKSTVSEDEVKSSSVKPPVDNTGEGSSSSTPPPVDKKGKDKVEEGEGAVIEGNLSEEGSRISSEDLDEELPELTDELQPTQDSLVNEVHEIPERTGLFTAFKTVLKAALVADMYLTFAISVAALVVLLPITVGTLVAAGIAAVVLAPAAIVAGFAGKAAYKKAKERNDDEDAKTRVLNAKIDEFKLTGVQNIKLRTMNARIQASGEILSDKSIELTDNEKRDLIKSTLNAIQDYRDITGKVRAHENLRAALLAERNDKYPNLQYQETSRKPKPLERRGFFATIGNDLKTYFRETLPAQRRNKNLWSATKKFFRDAWEKIHPLLGAGGAVITIGGAAVFGVSTVLSATGVGAIAGVPLMIVSGAIVASAVGIGLTAAAIDHFVDSKQKDRIKILKDKNELLESVDDSSEALRKQITTINEAKKLKEQISNLQNRLEKAEAEKKKQLQPTDENVKGIEKLKRELLDAQTQLSKFEKGNERLQTQQEILQEQFDQQAKENAQLKERIQVMQNDNVTLQNKLLQVGEENKELKKQQIQPEVTTKTIQQQIPVEKESSTLLKEAREEITHLKNDLGELRQMVTAYQGQLAESRERIKHLEDVLKNHPLVGEAKAGFEQSSLFGTHPASTAAENKKAKENKDTTELGPQKKNEFGEITSTDEEKRGF